MFTVDFLDQQLYLEQSPLVPAVKQGDLDFGRVVGEVDRGAQLGVHLARSGAGVGVGFGFEGGLIAPETNANQTITTQIAPINLSR